MIVRQAQGDRFGLILRYSRATRLFGLFIAGVSTTVLVFYLKSYPTDRLVAFSYSGFLLALIALGLSLVARRVEVSNMSIVDRRLLRKRRITIREDTIVGKSRHLVVLRNQKGRVIYRFDPDFYNGEQLEKELNDVFRPETRSN